MTPSTAWPALTAAQRQAYRTLDTLRDGYALYPAEPPKRTRHGRFVLLLMAFALFMLTLPVLAQQAIAADPERCTAAEVRAVRAEDDRCWTWTRHGNGWRGVTLRNGRHVVVSACGYRRLYVRRAIDHRRTPALRGDWWARKHGCRPSHARTL